MNCFALNFVLSFLMVKKSIGDNYWNKVPFFNEEKLKKK